ncbi:hypothetical protein QT711_07835 [Sporosarcina saromensis]|uniref:Uncharacterized protein n=1 Tax=Sporosarcina saromensis TaxID=359365 RepID=A0ABU4G9T9_9BACL|nr:hypothetical protein [Sporosarcina saromensis]MDW0113093.1 hypothetical protein [Sporosarcina saromensis]
MYIELTNQALSTILLDAIQYFPNYEHAKEAYGLLLGTEEDNNSIAEYTFPVGNVTRRIQTSVTENPEISSLIRNARKIVATSNAVASYHSHPYKMIWSDWARPSNSDCFCVVSQDIKMELIIGIAKVNKVVLPLTLNYQTGAAKEFIPNTDDVDKNPYVKELGTNIQYIEGSFGYYKFEIRGYQNTGTSLIDLDLYSSEVTLNKILRENDVSIEQLPAEAMYSVRKIEYAARKRAARNADDKIIYHIEKIKGMELMPIPLESKRIIDGQNYLGIDRITYSDAIRWARSGQLFADLYEETTILCNVGYDESDHVLFLEDLEYDIGSTIDVKEYMVEEGYIEHISLGNIERFPMKFWLLEGAV